MSTVFISYRREDSAGHAGRLHDYLRQRPEVGTVFMDVSAIEPGVDFVDTIEAAVGRCDVLLAILGKDWLECTDEAGRRRLDDPHDFIRLETATALRRGIRVIPVLVQGAKMPRSEDLPDDLKPLVRRQAVELRDSRWEDDVAFLIDRIAQAMRSTEAKPAAAQPAASGDPGKPPPAPGAVQAAPPPPSAQPRSRTPLVAGIVVAAVLAMAAGAWMLRKESVSPAPVPGPAPAQPPKAPPKAAAAKVYVHTSEKRDLKALEDLGNSLRSKGYEVPDTRLTSARTEGDIRYFFPQDRDEAGRLKTLVESDLARQGYRVSLRVLERDGTKFEHSSPGKIEIWLPPLSK